MAEFAAAALIERDQRAARYPAAIAAGKMAAEDGEADYQAWHAIHAWLTRGEITAIGAWLNWRDLEDAAARAATSLAAAAAKHPADPDRARRRDRVSAIHARLSRQRAEIEELNRHLRTRAAERRAAA